MFPGTPALKDPTTQVAVRADFFVLAFGASCDSSLLCPPSVEGKLLGGWNKRVTLDDLLSIPGDGHAADTQSLFQLFEQRPLVFQGHEKPTIFN